MVEIPADVAKRYAYQIRSRWDCDDTIAPLADLLDPQPTLREQVAAHICQAVVDASGLTHDAPEWDADYADAVLAVVADWLAAQPLLPSGIYNSLADVQRDHDVRLLRGES